MKKSFLLSGAIHVTVASAMLFNPNDFSFATPASCMERSSYQEKWRPNGKGFKECKQLNDATDGDNIFDKSGLFYWDSGS